MALLGLVVMVLVMVAAAGGRGAHLPHPEPDGPREDTGFVDSGVFGWTRRPSGEAVTLGEDLGLFLVGSTDKARALAEELNHLYHEQCPTCGVYRLEPAGFRIGRHRDPKSGQERVALFYAHAESPTVIRRPVLLTLVDEQQAARLGTTPKYLAGYWRDLTRDLVEISRARPASSTPLGQELNRELLQARQRLGPEPAWPI